MYAGKTLIDSIIAVLPHKDGDILICASDLQSPLDRKKHTLREAIIDGLLVVEARNLGIIPTKTMVDGIIANIQKRLKITPDQLEEMFAEQGLTTEEARDMLKRRRMVEEVVNMMVRVDDPSKEEIAEYHAAHIKMSPATYVVQPGFVRSDAITKKELTSMLRTGKSHAAVEWYDAEPILDSALSEEQAFVRKMKAGEIRLLGDADGGYELVRVTEILPASEMPMDETEISLILREQKFVEGVKAYHASLLERAVIRWCDADAEKRFKAEVEQS